MGSCEMCGTSTENLTKVKIAGSIMNVCNSCKNLGKTQNEGNEKKSYSFYHKKKENKDNFILINNYTSLINSSLAKKKLTVHHLARALNIKESLLHKVLTNKFDLEINLAKKIEDFLKIKLVIKEEDSKSNLDLDEILVSEKETKNQNLADLIKEKLNLR